MDIRGRLQKTGFTLYRKPLPDKVPISGIKMTGFSKTSLLIFGSFRTVPRIDFQILAGE